MKSRDVIQISNPYSGEQVGSVPVAGQKDVEEAVRRARAAFHALRKRTAFDRYTFLMQAAAKIKEHGDRLARLLTAEIGKPILVDFFTEW